MTISQVSDTALASSLFSDTANTSTVVAVKASSASVSYIEADNTVNAAATYLKIWNVGSGSVVIGTTVPDMIVLLPASTKVMLVFPTALVFATALSLACTTTAALAGVTGPGTALSVKVAYT